MKHRSGEFITMNKMGSFQGIIANLTADPTGLTMRSILYHQVGPNRFFTQSGSNVLFCPTDTKQEDRFINNFPLCNEDSSVGRRQWLAMLWLMVHSMICTPMTYYVSELWLCRLSFNNLSINDSLVALKKRQRNLTYQSSCPYNLPVEVEKSTLRSPNMVYSRQVARLKASCFQLT